MATTNGSQESFLTPLRTASSGGVRVFRVEESLPLSAHDKKKLSAVLAHIVEQYPADGSGEKGSDGDIAAADEAAGKPDPADDGTSH